MSRYQITFNKLKEKNEKALIGFVVLGDPDIETSLEIVKTMVNAGVDILELGIPFSDPIADGPTIQAADVRALSTGVNTDKAFDIISKIRKFTCIPIGLLVYYNLIYQRGIDKFYEDTKKAGVDSVLAADLSVEEAEDSIQASKKYGINQVFIISQLTSDGRMNRILDKTSGFVYAVARLGVTGARADLQTSALELVKRIKKQTSLPVCVGFGISKPEHVRKVCEAGADGAIVGSAIVKLVEENLSSKENMLRKIKDYVWELKEATKKIK